MHTDTQHLRPERSCTEFFKRLTGNQAWQAVPAKICSLWTGYGGEKKKKVSQYNVLKNQLPAFLIVCTQKLQNILQPYLPFIKTFNFSPKSLKWHAHHTDMQQIIELSLTSKKWCKYWTCQSEATSLLSLSTQWSRMLQNRNEKGHDMIKGTEVWRSVQKGS